VSAYLRDPELAHAYADCNQECTQSSVIVTIAGGMRGKPWRRQLIALGLGATG